MSFFFLTHSWHGDPFICQVCIDQENSADGLRCRRTLHFYLTELHVVLYHLSGPPPLHWSRRLVVYAGTDDLLLRALASAAVLFWGGDFVFTAPGTGVFWDAAWYSETQVMTRHSL